MTTKQRRERLRLIRARHRRMRRAQGLPVHLSPQEQRAASRRLRDGEPVEDIAEHYGVPTMRIHRAYVNQGFFMGRAVGQLKLTKAQRAATGKRREVIESDEPCVAPHPLPVAARGKSPTERGAAVKPRARELKGLDGAVKRAAYSPGEKHPDVAGGI